MGRPFVTVGRQSRYWEAKALGEDGYCRSHDRYFKTHVKRYGRVVSTGGCPQCQSGAHDSLREARHQLRER